MEDLHALLRERRPDGEGIDVAIGSSNGRHHADRLVPQMSTTNCNTRADGRSIHCASSMATTTGAVDDYRTDAPQDGQSRRPWSAAPAGTRRSQEGHLQGPRAAARGASAGSRPGRSRRGRRGRCMRDASRPRRGCTRASGGRARGLPPVPPSKRSSSRCRITLQDRRAARPGRDRVSGSDAGSRELGLAPDDVTGQRRSPSFVDAGFYGIADPNPANLSRPGPFAGRVPHV